ncbi:armadillo repeat-containing protein 10 [Gastrophryne carolinensis]
MAGKVPVSRGLLGLALAAGLGYCVYRFMARTEKRKTVTGGSIVQKAATITVRPPTHSVFQSENIPTSASDLGPLHIRALLEGLAADNADPSFQEQVLITLANSAAFSRNHDIIRSSNGIRIIGKLISDPSPKIKAKALNALNNLSLNLENQEQIKDFLCDVCNEIGSSSLNSEVQLAALRLTINMSVTDKYHNLLVDYIPCFLSLLEDGDEVTQINTLKVLVNLSANPSMTTALLSSKVSPAVINLFGSTNADILTRALTFAANLSENSEREQFPNHSNYGDNTLYGLLIRDKTMLQEGLAALLHHPDTGVKELVARLLCSKR